MANISKIKISGTTYNIDDTSKLPLTGGQVSGDIYPNANTTCDLGTSSAEWRHIYALGVIASEGVHVGDGVYLGATSITASGTITGNKVYGAVWNDYAEYRTSQETITPGYCVASSNNGEIYKTTERLQACDGIVSDTFGFAIGQTDSCDIPLAVAGRVLAYCEGDRNAYQAGDPVCASANGFISKMTREEVKEWPDRIVGIVSEIPAYDTWGSDNIKVDNRIWIKVK